MQCLCLQGNGADSDDGEAEAEEVQDAADGARGQGLPTLDQAIARSELIQVRLVSAVLQAGNAHQLESCGLYDFLASAWQHASQRCFVEPSCLLAPSANSRGGPSAMTDLDMEFHIGTLVVVAEIYFG